MIDPDELAAWLHLLHSPGVGREAARRLLAHFGGPQLAVSAPPDELRQCVDAPTALTLANPPDGHDRRLADTLAWCAAGPQRRVMVLGDADYPGPLLHSADPPLLLYLQGHAHLLSTPSLAIVGSRKPSAQGRDHAHQFARALAGQGWTIVSGLAAGVDGAAHEGALEAGGHTIAVIGTGIDRVYPPSHRNLAHRIAERGLVVSELPLGAPPLSAHFPQRNRIIAGLSRGTLVVEAALRSGSLITARLASESGREVMAIPGSILAPQSAGCHALIRQGAALVYLLVRDYPTAALDTQRSQALHSPMGVLRFIAGALTSSRTLLWVCIGGAAQLIVVSAVWSWLPSFLNRVHGLPTEQAAMRAALVVLAGAAGGVLWGALTDRAARRQPRGRLRLVAALCLVSLLVLVVAFGAPAVGLALTPATQFGLILCGGLVMTCTVGPASVVVMDVVHPGVRATGAAVLSLFQNLFGLALGPVIAGALSDALGLATALTITPLFGLIAAWAFMRASRSYEADTAKARPADDAADGSTPREPQLGGGPRRALTPTSGTATAAIDAATAGSSATATHQPGRAALA